MLLHTRKVYGLFDAFGDIGGIIEVLTIFVGFFLAPYNEHMALRDFFRNNYRVSKGRKSKNKKSRNNYAKNVDIRANSNHSSFLQSFCFT